MKKLFLSTLGVFALSLLFSLNYQSDSVVANEAFADGTCCPELNSICVTPTYNISNYYFKSEGSCKTTPVIGG